MNRRQFITLLGGAAAWPLAATAQQGDRVRRIGVLIGTDETDPLGKPRLSAFTQALTDLGWTDGRNIRIETRWGSGDIGYGRSRSPCCAHAAIGHAAALPSPAMNSRRRIGHASKPLCGQRIAVRVAWERVASRGANFPAIFFAPREAASAQML